MGQIKIDLSSIPSELLAQEVQKRKEQDERILAGAKARLSKLAPIVPVRGRPKSPRCKCGKMTVAKAEKQKHRCS
jgi:hypothetical protein